MLFNSYAFIFGFMPLTLLLFHGLRVAGFERGSIAALAMMSLDRKSTRLNSSH